MQSPLMSHIVLGIVANIYFWLKLVISSTKVVLLVIKSEII